MNVKYWICLALLAPTLVLAQEQEQEQAVEIGRALPAGSAMAATHSVEQADSRLAQVAQERAAAEAEFAAGEQLCYGKFFVNRCIDQAKEKRRVRLSELRAVEVEASYFKRRHAVEIRDRELEDRAQKDAAEEAYRAANPTPPRADAGAKSAPRPASLSLEQRQAEHDTRERQRQAESAAKAPQRAANAAAFERKKEESAKRQAEIAAKLAAKQAKQRKQAEEAAAKAAAQPSPQP
jgi:colicin import membrane protein